MELNATRISAYYFFFSLIELSLTDEQADHFHFTELDISNF